MEKQAYITISLAQQIDIFLNVFEVFILSSMLYLMEYIVHIHILKLINNVCMLSYKKTRKKNKIKQNLIPIFF